MNNHSRFSLRLICVTLAIALLLPILSGCAAQSTPSQTEPFPSSAPSATLPASPTAAPSLSPTLPPTEDMAAQFITGTHPRDEYCSRVFDFHQMTFEPLTIIIADNLIEPVEPQDLVDQVISRYVSLSKSSPLAFNQPTTVTVLSTPEVGECFSTRNLVFVAPDNLDSRTFAEDLLGATAGINEYWIRSGLVSLALGEQPDQAKLQNWYLNTDDLDMAGLFIARFMEDWATEEEREIARMSAASLVQYALEVEKIQPDKLEEQVNNDVRTRWLQSLGVDRTVTYPYDGLFTGFLYSQKSDCQLFVKTNSMDFCLNRIPTQEYFDEVSDAEFLIYHAYYGRQALVEYILSEAPSVQQLMNPDETITIEVKELEDRLGYTIGNTITINRSSVYYDPLDMIVHTFDWNERLSNNQVWLSVGFAEYLGKLLPIYPQTAQRCIFEDLSGQIHGSDSVAPGTSYCYFLDPEQLEAAKQWYLAQGGRMETEEVVDPRLFTDAVAFATIYRDANGQRTVPMGVKFKARNPDFNPEGQEGLELSYTSAASFVAWMCDKYSLDQVLAVYVNHAENGLLDGKSYSELKSEWIADLRAKGAGIPIPGEP